MPRFSYINVAVALPVYDIFTYSIPDNLYSFVSIGKRVLVPFGRRSVTGYILETVDNIINDKAIKPVIDVLDEKPLFFLSMIPFFKWIANYYMYPIGEVIKCALPAGINIYDFAAMTITKEGEKALSRDLASSPEYEVLSSLKQGYCRLQDISKFLDKKIPNSLIHAMENRGWIERTRKLKKGLTKSRFEQYLSLIDPLVKTEGLSSPSKKVLETLKSEGNISVTELRKLVPVPSNLIRSLEHSKYISICKKRIYRDPFGESIKPDTAPYLTNEQKGVISSVLSSLGKGFATYLLAGVTGSGKTEVYMRLVAETVKGGYFALVLVPEITLISQIERRFRARFGESIAVLHSGLSKGEHYDQWNRIVNREAAVVIGARSAVFAPFDNIGIVIVDEEHDTSYKQEKGLRYNARDIAIVRAKLQDCVVLLGSATPSIQSYYNVKKNKFIELNLKKRIEKRPLPEITIVDLCKIRDNSGIRRFITSELYEAMKEALSRGEQILLFLNRRGFAGFSVCNACGNAIKCKYCDVSLTFHHEANVYKCHYCGFTMAPAANCQSCGSTNIKLLGLGTEKVASAVKTIFPNAKVARMDRDTTRQKGAILKILKDVKEHATDILIGTQMVAKGHDYPNITLVGIICADLSLNFPDFRAGERTFQLLAQVSGRAGRGTAPGKVILQTYNPHHFSILAAKDQDFKKFYNEEIKFRKALNYPPFSRMIQLKISGRNEKKTELYAQSIGDFCSTLIKKNKFFIQSIEVLGPIKAYIHKIAKEYRWQILLKGMDVKCLHKFVNDLIFEKRSVFNKRNVKVVVDVDPFFFF
ncbi:MAG: primosomal protein N' [Deltaproteobacteria bacterium]|nr:MAG: primosomal protein N' [Deltaproteobacteria bacterium]